ncbi:hypothetical protein GCM10017673_06320 [Streptosporangium violaceochromogenes]|nr:hypothetical protein GCM10017673_06320 [Streptosporangium violaceochromogenes]
MSAALTLGLVTAVPGPASAHRTPVSLGAAADYAVVAGTAVVNTGFTRVVGGLAVSPGSALTGFPPGVVTGQVNRGNAAAATVMADVVTARNNVAARPTTATVPVELGGTTKAPGVYQSAGTSFTVTGTLTLDAQGDPRAIFVFRAGSLSALRLSNVNLVGGAREDNVFWQVDSATLGVYSLMRGNILALKSILVRRGATLYGRATTVNETITVYGTPRPPATRLVLPNNLPTTTVLTSSPNPSTVGQQVVLTATVTTPVQAAAVPAGRVVFKDGLTVIGVARHDASGPAVLKTTALQAGEHQLTAVYLGGQAAVHEAWVGFGPSVSPVLVQTVNAS